MEQNTTESSATDPIASDEEMFAWIFQIGNPVYPPEMKSAQKQADILARMNELRRLYAIIKKRSAVVQRRKKLINKRKRASG